MDLLTHALSGALLGQSVAKEKMKFSMLLGRDLPVQTVQTR